MTGNIVDLLNFDLIILDEDVREEERREAIPHELEADIGTELLPYLSAPIIKVRSTNFDNITLVVLNCELNH